MAERDVPPAANAAGGIVLELLGPYAFGGGGSGDVTGDGGTSASAGRITLRLGGSWAKRGPRSEVAFTPHDVIARQHSG